MLVASHLFTKAAILTVISAIVTGISPLSIYPFVHETKAWAIPADIVEPQEQEVRPRNYMVPQEPLPRKAEPISAGPAKVIVAPAVSSSVDNKCSLFNKTTAIVSINYQKLVQENPGMSNVQSSMKYESEKAKQEFEAKASRMGEKEKQEYYQQLQQRLQLKNQDLMMPVFNEVDNAIKRIADAWSIGAVIDASSVICNSFDISSAVEEAMLRGVVRSRPPELRLISEALVGVVNYQQLIQGNSSMLMVQRRMQTETENVKREFDTNSSRMGDKEKQEYYQQLQQRLQLKNQELMMPVFNEVNNAIKRVADGLGLQIVVDKGATVYGGTDITDRAK